MFCSKCGKEIENTSSFCPFCGQPAAAAQPAPTYENAQMPNEYPRSAPQETPAQYPQGQPAPYQQVNYVPQYTPQPAPKKSNKGLILAIVLPCVAVFIVIAILLSSFISKGNEKAQLQEQLLRDWSRVESNDGTYYTLRLDFDDDEIEYIFDSTYVDRTIATYDYEVVSGDTIKVEGFGTVKIKFNDDKTMMTFTPSITDTEASENWFNFD